MKKLLTTVFLAKTRTMMAMSLFAILALTSAYGQSTPQPMFFKAQFKFSAGGKTFPIGKYQINHEPKSEYVTLRDESGAITKLKVLTLLARDTSAAPSRIVFDNVGDALVSFRRSGCQVRMVFWRTAAKEATSMKT